MYEKHFGGKFKFIPILSWKITFKSIRRLHTSTTALTSVVILAVKKLSRLCQNFELIKGSLINQESKACIIILFTQIVLLEIFRKIFFFRGLGRDEKVMGCFIWPFLKKWWGTCPRPNLFRYLFSILLWFTFSTWPSPKKPLSSNELGKLDTFAKSPFSPIIEGLQALKTSIVLGPGWYTDVTLWVISMKLWLKEALLAHHLLIISH